MTKPRIWPRCWKRVPASAEFVEQSAAESRALAGLLIEGEAT